MSLEQAVVQLEQTNAALQEEVVRFRDAAMGLNAVYPTITEGRQNTADGKYFSVPGNGAYMRLYRRTGSSSELIAEFPDRDELNSVIDQLGPLLGRGVVGGAGDLMAKGAYGIGTYTAPGLIDVDAADTESGLYRVVSGTRNRTSSPGDGGIGYMIINRLSNVLVNQIYTEHSTGRVFSRTYQSGAWKNWIIGYDTNNIVGPVSNDAGLPSGAIIENGTNANGRYTKFADGTLICSFSRSDGSGIASETTGAVYRSSESFSFPDFPHSFITAPIVVCDFSHENGYGHWGVKGGIATASNPGGGYQYYSARPFNAAASLRMSYVAHGRWY